MKKTLAIILILIISVCVIPLLAFAAEGDCGYEGGISTGEAVAKSYDYQEVIYLTGKPIVVKGTVTVKKTIKAATESWAYTYLNLKNVDEKVTLNRTVAYDVAISPKNNGQVQKQVTLKGIPTERIIVDKAVYVLKNYNFSKSTIADVKPFGQYFAGEFLGEKTYTVSGGTNTSIGTITVGMSGKIFGYNQPWSNTESQLIDYYIHSDGDKKWAGKATVGISMTSAKKLKYEENKPDEISFKGGYVNTKNNVSILQYESDLPEFDAKGQPTDYLINSKDTLKYDTNPSVNRLVVPSLPQMKGHWAENDVKLLYSLEIFRDNAENFKPNEYMTRADFAKAMVLTGKLFTDQEVALAESGGQTNGSTNSNAKKQTQVFDDVPVDYPGYAYIQKVYDNKLMNGVSLREFAPQATLTRAQAVTLLIRGLGFEGRAPSPTTATSFRDNNSIPSWARNAVYAAEKIGLVKGYMYGNFDPNKPMTKAEIAILINRFITYMGQDIIKDYRDNVILY
jgi:hypothetical protein